MKRFATTALVGFLSAVSASAQPAHGDFVLSASGIGLGRGGLLYFDRSTNNLVTLTTVNPFRSMRGVAMAADNVDMVAGDFRYHTRMVNVTPTGVVTTVGTVWGLGGSLEVVQNGNFVWATRSSVQEIDGAGNVTTLVQGDFHAVGRDHDTDTLLVSDLTHILLWDPRVRRLSTLYANPLGIISGLDQLPSGWAGSAAFAAVGEYPNELQILTPRGVVSSLAATSLRVSQSLRVDDATGQVFLTTSGGRLFEIDPVTNTRVRSWYWPIALNGIELYGSRRVYGAGSGARGSAYAIQLDFGPRAANAPVLGALAFAQFPGIRIPGVGTVNLAPDPLLVASLSGLLNGSVLRGFPPVLDANGRASGTVSIPRGIRSGVTFYYSAIAIVQQSLVEVANTIGVRVP